MLSAVQCSLDTQRSKSQLQDTYSRVRTTRMGGICPVVPNP